MTTKTKKCILSIIACICIGLIAIFAARCQVSLYNDLQTTEERYKIAEDLNGQLEVKNLTLETTINEQQQKLEQLQANNDELSRQIEELRSDLRSKNSAPTISRGEYGRTVTLEITGYSSGDGLCPSTRMANGETAHVGAAAMNGVPFGTRVYVPELDRVVVVKDRCGYDGVLDIYCDTVSECYQIGRRTCEVQILD